MKRLGTLVLLALLCSAAPAAAADDILIQWRAFPDPTEICANPSWPTCYEVRNGVQYTKELSLSGAVDSNGLEYGRRFYRFDGVDDYIWVPTLANADTDDGLTVRAWFRPQVLSGRQVIISNTNAAGFSLHLDDTHVTGQVNIAGTYYSVTSQTHVRLNKWNQATFVVDLDGDDMESTHIDGGENRAMLTLVLNGQQSDQSFLLTPVGTNPRMLNSTKHPLLGAEPNANGGPTQWFFKGDIEAVNVRNYPIEWDSQHPHAQLGANDWLTVPPPEDGGIKGGEPSYYDSRIDEASLTVDARFANPDSYDSSRVNIHSLVPFINDEYIVQGIASTCPAAGICIAERLFLSLYWASASQGSPGNRSLIVEIDPKEDSGGRILSCRALTGTLESSHVGGLGYHVGKLYVGGSKSGVSYAERYPLWPKDGDPSCRPIAPDRIDTVKESGSLSIQNGSLLVSDYAYAKDLTDLDAELFVYDILPGGTLQLQEGRYCLPHLIEGVAFVDFEGSPYLVMTHLTKGLIRMSAEAAYQQAPCTSGDVPSYEVIARSAKGSQDLALAASRIWFANESGSKQIQQTKQAEWPYLFPFVAWVDLAAIPAP